MSRRSGPGLRLQILFALCVAFLFSLGLLDLVAVRLAERSREHARIRDAQATARVVAASLASAPLDEVRFRTVADVLLAEERVVGVELRLDLGPRFSRGDLRALRTVETEVPGVGLLRLHLPDPGGRDRSRFGDYLLLYVALTGGAILLLTYVALTVLIVRPVEELTLASERLARGQLEVEVPLSGSGEVTRLGVAFNHMAERLRADRDALEKRLAELTETTADLRSAQEQIVQAEKLASVGRLSAGIAHEIGNPLAAILGLIELLRGGDLPPPEQAEFLARIQRETERIHAIIRDLLDFARRGRGAEDPSATARPGAVVEEALALLRPQKEVARVAIRCELDPDLPRVPGSADRLTQVVMNLLLNAVDAVAGQGTIGVSVRRSGDEAVEIAVDDSGPGIAPEVRAHLFEPFVTTKPAGRGTGLGLAVCHTIIERLGGTIRAENRTEGGARFVVHLPIAREAKP